MGRHLALARDRVDGLAAQEPQDRSPPAPPLRELSLSLGPPDIPGVRRHSSSTRALRGALLIES